MAATFPSRARTWLLRVLRRAATGCRNIQAASTNRRLIEVNGDRLYVPCDLLKFIQHTCVSHGSAAVPQFLIETPHYTWIRDRLQVGDNALDLGANIGILTVMMAKKVKYGEVGWVHALEPSPSVCADLRRVVDANRLQNVCTAQLAVADQSGKAVFMEIPAESVVREASHLAGIGHGSPANEKGVEVETITVDDYLARSGLAPRLIKIDVEGAEFLVLEGARRCLREQHPLLVIEFHPDPAGVFDHARLRRILDEYGYIYQQRGKTYYCE